MRDRKTAIKLCGNAKNELMEGGNLLKLMADSLPVLISYVDSSRRYRFTNRAYEEWFGRSRDEVEGRHVREVLGVRAYKVIKKHIDSALSGNRIEYETSVPYEKAGNRYIIASYVPHKNKEGEVTGFFAIINDITARRELEEELQQAKEALERKVRERTLDLESTVKRLHSEIAEREKAEDRLRKSELWLNTILDQLDEAVLVASPDRKITYINSAAERMFGYSRKEILGKSTEILNIDKPHYRKFGSVIRTLLDKRTKLRPFEFKGKRKNGEIFPTENIVSIMRDKTGNVTGLIGVVRDITERKRAEEALVKAKEEIEAWNRELQQRVAEKTDELVASRARLIENEKLSAMGRMAGGLAHELNSPLAGLLPMLEEYRNRVPKGSRDHNELSLMIKSCNHMAKIVKDFGSFTRTPGETLSPLSLNEVVEDTLSFLSGRLKQQGIVLTTEYSKKLPLILGNKTELQQVVLNLATNAVDAMKTGGAFHIKTAVLKNKVKMELTDNGEGIRKESLDKIFEPFFTTKEAGEGTGLGLSVSYGIIHKLDGEILVKSIPGKGTTFTVLLPFLKNQPAC